MMGKAPLTVCGSRVYRPLGSAIQIQAWASPPADEGHGGGGGGLGVERKQTGSCSLCSVGAAAPPLP